MAKINKLKREARAVIAAFDPNADFEETVLKLAAIGFGIESALKNA